MVKKVRKQRPVVGPEYSWWDLFASAPLERQASDITPRIYRGQSPPSPLDEELMLRAQMKRARKAQSRFEYA